MAKKELTLEVFQRELGDKWNEWKGNWKEDLFHELLDEYNFEENKVRREALRINLKKLGFFEGGSKASTKTSVSEELAALIKQQDAKVKINPHIIDRMIKQFATRVTLALSQRDPELTLELYAETEALPQTQTEQDLELKGYHIDGSLLADNDSLVICFKGTKPCVLKTLTEKEAKRMALVLPQLQQSGKMLSSYIVDMEIVSSKKKQFVVMPLMPTTLEQLKLTAPEDVKRAYLQMKEALTLLHKKGFAHMDIKPSNICINHAGDFVLIDFGSAVPFNIKSAFTAAYIPHGLAPNPARPEVDWWMLAATLSEKAGNSDRWSKGAKNPTREETLESLQSFPYIVNDLQPFLKD